MDKFVIKLKKGESGKDEKESRPTKEGNSSKAASLATDVEKSIGSANETAEELFPAEGSSSSVLGKRKSNDGDSEESREVSKYKSSKKKYFNKFASIWLNLPEFKGWLQKAKETSQGHELAYCKVCDMNFTAHKIDITRHSQSERHIRRLSEIVTNKDITKIIQTPVSQQQKRAELKLAGFIAEKNLPLSTIDDLSEILPDLFPDSKIAKSLSIHRTKTTALLKNSLAPGFKKELTNQLSEPGSFISIIMDETTDRGSIKQCAFVAIYYDLNENLVKTRFLDMKETPSSTANDLVHCLKSTLQENGIPLENMVGFSSDTTNVMFGEYHSVASMLKNEVPHGVFIKCSCHLIHLVASRACLMLPRTIEDLLRNLGSHFSRSYGRKRKLQEFQEFFSVEVHKILSLSTTRWLSCKQVVDRVLEQYQVLSAYLRESVYDDPSKTTEEMFSVMENQFTELYLQFMSYSLGLFNSLNKLFQTESPLLHKVKPELENLIKTIGSNYMTKASLKGDIFTIGHKNPKNFIEDDKIYLGLRAHELLEKIKNDPDSQKEDIKHFLNAIRNFYIESITQLKVKFDMSDPIFEIVRVLDPEAAQKSETYSTLLPVFKRFPFLEKFVSLPLAEQQWRDHGNLNHEELGLDATLAADRYWRKVFSLRDGAGNKKFEHLKKVIQLLLVLPFSNASVERIFSSVNNIKTYNRNRLNTDTLNALLMTKEGVSSKGGSKEFEPSEDMYKVNIWK